MMISTHASWRAGLCAAAIAFAGAGCGPNIDVAAALRLESVTTGWVDVGPVGQSPAAHERTNKVVPSVSFMVKNVTDRTLAPVQVNAVFRRLGDPSEWTNGTAQAAGSDGLAPSTASERLVIKGGVGYTGTDSNWDLLENSHFVDATVAVFARYGSRQWVRIGEYPIARQIIER
jgi:hypothetical protein